MARPRSENKRNAILAAATRVFAEQGLAAPTARIAREAGVADGTLFTYFASKDELLNELYVSLKEELRDVMLAGFPGQASLRERVHHIWIQYLDWAARDPGKRRTLTLLSVSERVANETREKVAAGFAEINALQQAGVQAGAFAGASPMFIGALMGAVAETTLDFIAREPGAADTYREAGFAALWAGIGSE